MTAGDHGFLDSLVFRLIRDWLKRLSCSVVISGGHYEAVHPRLWAHEIDIFGLALG